MQRWLRGGSEGGVRAPGREAGSVSCVGGLCFICKALLALQASVTLHGSAPYPRGSLRVTLVPEDMTLLPICCCPLLVLLPRVCGHSLRAGRRPRDLERGTQLCDMPGSLLGGRQGLAAHLSGNMWMKRGAVRAVTAQLGAGEEGLVPHGLTAGLQGHGRLRTGGGVGAV